MPKRLFLLFCFACYAPVTMGQLISPHKAIPPRVIFFQSQRDSLEVQYLLQQSEVSFSKPERKAEDLRRALSLAKDAAALSKSVHYPEGTGKSNFQLSRVYRELQQPEKSKAALNEAAVAFNAARAYTDLGYTWWEMTGYYSLMADELPTRISFAEKSLQAFRLARDVKKEADVLKELADLQQVNGQYTEALANLKQALVLYQSIKEPVLQGIYDLMCTVATSLGDFEEGLKYGLMAEQSARNTQDTSLQLCTIYNHIGIVYYYRHELANAELYYRKAMKIATQYNAQETIYNMMYNLINTLSKGKRHADALKLLESVTARYPNVNEETRGEVLCSFINLYRKLGQNHKSKPYFDELSALVKSTPFNENFQHVLYSTIIPYLTESRRFTEARAYLVSHERLAREKGSLIQLWYNQQFWSTLDAAQGHYDSALIHYKRYKQLNDSMFNIQKNKEFALANTKYQTAQKDRDIQAQRENIGMLRQQAALREKNLQQAMTVRNITFASIVLLVIIILLLYNRYRIKQKNSRQMGYKNERLEQLLTEKEWLLKEIHHRVKNNLQIIMSLLESQSAYMDDDAALMAIRDSQHRVQSMSLIHQKLYQVENLSTIDMNIYIRELVAYLRDGFSTGQRIGFDLQLEHVELDVSQAIPIGLILNEAITNAIKYAFPLHREGVITIALCAREDGTCLLMVSDDGVGLPPDFNENTCSSLGMSLMRGLSEDLNGEFEICRQEGTTINITFVVDLQIKQHATHPSQKQVAV